MIKKCRSLVVLFLVLFLTGCDNFSLPEEMIEKPAMDSRIEVSKYIRKSFPSAYEIILPRNLESAAAINYSDISGNGKEEMIILYKEKEKLNKFGIRTMRKYINTWEYIDEIREEAVDIRNVHFKDVNNDGKTDIIVEWMNKDETLDVGIYTEEKEKIFEIFKFTCDEMKIEDLDEDGIQDVVALNSTENNSLEAVLYNFDGKSEPIVNKVEIFSDRKIRTISANVGHVTKNKVGIVLDIPFEANQGYTEILVKEKGKLKKIFSKEGDFGITKSISSTNNWDIDGDGIIEINILYDEKSMDPNSNNVNPTIQRWFNWDGNEGLILKHHVYYDSANGFRFFIPNNWIGNYIIELNEGSKVQYIFIYQKNNYPTRKTEIARIVIVEDSYLDEFKQKYAGTKRVYESIGRNEGKNYLLSNNNKDENILEYLKVNDDQIKDNFKMLK